MPQASVEVGGLIAEKYRTLRVLGEGGMGTVYEAEHVTLGERVAIKVLLPALADRPEIVERFLREARASLRIRSEHVARVNDVGTLASGAPFMVLEMLQGSDLGEVIDEQRTLPVAVAVGYVLQACEAIAEAHAIGIIHRDIKPANLFVTQRVGGQPLVKVLDFGIAKALVDDPDSARLTSSSASIGSPMYMSPEQIRDSRTADGRSDVWSLGVTLYELLSGQLPFPAESVNGALAKIMTEPPVSLATALPGAPAELAAVIDRALAKDPAKRYPSVAHFAFALLPFAPSGQRHAERARDALGVRDPVGSLVATASVPAPPRASSRTPLVVAGFAVALAAVAGVAVMMRSTPTAPSATRDVASAPTVSPDPPAKAATSTVDVEPVVTPAPSASQAPAAAKATPPRPVAKPATPTDKGFDARKF